MHIKIKLLVIFMALLFVTACSFNKAHTVAVENNKKSEKNQKNTQLQPKCMHLQRDLTIPFNQRSYFCNPDKQQLYKITRPKFNHQHVFKAPIKPQANPMVYQFDTTALAPALAQLAKSNPAKFNPVKSTSLKWQIPFYSSRVYLGKQGLAKSKRIAAKLTNAKHVYLRGVVLNASNQQLSVGRALAVRQQLLRHSRLSSQQFTILHQNANFRGRANHYDGNYVEVFYDV